MSFKRENS
jgi:hypothetical protein